MAAPPTTISLLKEYSFPGGDFPMVKAKVIVERFAFQFLSAALQLAGRLERLRQKGCMQT